MKLPTKDLRLTANPGFSNPLERLILNLNDILSRTNAQLNLLSEGTLAAVHNAATAAPAQGKFGRGDFIRNAEPSELGAVGSKYVVAGWICVAAGEPGTWVDCRYLTGN
jgi:hypothetical protein